MAVCIGHGCEHSSWLCALPHGCVHSSWLCSLPHGYVYSPSVVYISPEVEVQSPQLLTSDSRYVVYFLFQ
jgi:hypothetical protein